MIPRVGSLVTTLFKWLIKLSNIVAMGAVYGMIGLIVVEVIMRNFFRCSTLVADELGGYLNAVVIFMGLGFTLQARAHIRVEILYIRLPQKLQSILELCTCILSSAVSIVLTYWSWHFWADKYRTGTVSWTVLYTPQYIPQLFMSIGLSILALQAALDLVEQINRVKTIGWLKEPKEVPILKDQIKTGQ